MVVGEGQAQAVRAEIPVEGVRAGREVLEERYGVREVWEFGGGNGSEAGVVEGAGKAGGLMWG